MNEEETQTNPSAPTQAEATSQPTEQASSTPTEQSQPVTQDQAQEDQSKLDVSAPEPVAPAEPVQSSQERKSDIPSLPESVCPQEFKGKHPLPLDLDGETIEALCAYLEANSESLDIIEGPEFDTLKLAKGLYSTYSEAVGGKAFNGDPLPTADAFFADPTKVTQSKAWTAAAEFACKSLLAFHSATAPAPEAEAQSLTEQADQATK